MRIPLTSGSEFLRDNPDLILKGITLRNKTGLKPVSRPVEQAHYFGGWVEGAKSLWCQVFADR